MSETNGNNTHPELTLEQVRNSILDHLARGNSGHYNIGRLYNYTVDNGLAEKNGYDSAQQFFSQNFKELAQATLSRYGAVARQFSEEVCRKYGVVKLSMLSSYARNADLQLGASDPGNIPFEVPQDGGAPVQKPFAQCSVEELKQAMKHQRNPSKATLPPPDAARVEFLRQSFARHFAQGPRVQLKTSFQGGKTLITIQGVPVDDIERLMEAILDGFQPKLVRAV